jgi:hypothetical protein
MAFEKRGLWSIFHEYSMNHPVPLILNTIIVWSQICGFIPYIHYGFWGVLNVRGMG